jgi:hypothetical protein
MHHRFIKEKELMKRSIGFSIPVCLTVLFFQVLLAGCIPPASFSPMGLLGTSWKEELLLHDGRIVVVERSVKRGGRREIGQQGAYIEQSLEFIMPDTQKTIIWQDHFSQELGMANFLPMLLDIHNDEPYLVVSPMGCLSYNKWGRPNPPYIIFKYVNNEWLRIPMQELPDEIKTPNVISSAPDIEVERAKTSYMTKEMIEKIVSKYRTPEYKTILRTPLETGKNSVSSVGCEVMIEYKCNGVHVGWGAAGEFNRKYFEMMCR